MSTSSPSTSQSATQSVGTDAAVRKRPALFRALGNAEPPERVLVGDETFVREEIFKHDSWAATAAYVGPGRRIVCKFNRQQSILGLPAGWIGRWLARRETAFLRRLEPLGQTPRVVGEAVIDGRAQRHVCAREFIDGHPLGRYERVGDEFFPSLQRLLNGLHAAGIAYVDLHKRENILVGDDGRPYLIDFQVCAALPERLLRAVPLLRGLLTPLFRMDHYHVVKHHQRLRPDQCGLTRDAVGRARPFWVRIHRLIAEPLRELRRAFLTKLGIRRSGGRAHSELFPEDAVRREIETQPETPIRRAA